MKSYLAPTKIVIGLLILSIASIGAHLDAATAVKAPSRGSAALSAAPADGTSEVEILKVFPSSRRTISACGNAIIGIIDDTKSGEKINVAIYTIT